MRTASLHFATTLSKQKQPHTLTLHLEFMRRTQKGLAKFVVKEMKLGRQASVIHITLYQDDREEVVGYLSQTNLHTETGLSFPTDWSLQPPPLPADLSKFEDGGCPNWLEQKSMPFAEFRKAGNRMRWYFPRQGQQMRSISDQWVCWSSGQKFTQEALGFVCDNFPLVVESYIRDKPYDVAAQKKQTSPERKDKLNAARFWYPTLLLNLDIKKALPTAGAKYLFVRAQSKQIKNGRLDIEVTIMDEQHDLVAISHHVVLIVGSERNLSTRRKADSEKL